MSLLNNDSLKTTSWRWDGWLGAYPLNRNTLLDYFKHSQFYDRDCNNELILMQHIVDPSKIKSFKGVEYEVDNTSSDDPNYFLVKKQFRDGPSTVRPLELYYVVGVDPLSGTGPRRGTVFPLPSVFDVLTVTLDTFLHHVKQVFEGLSNHVVYAPGQPYAWDLVQYSGADVGTNIVDAKKGSKHTVPEAHISHLVDDILQFMSKNPPPAATAKTES